MRSIKSRGGLTRSRGVTESVQTVWINTAHRCSSVHEAMANLTSAKPKNREQHTEMGRNRIKRDNADLKLLLGWFHDHDPLNPNYTELRSVSSGVTAATDSSINCDNSEKSGANYATNARWVCC